ncbi:MAG: GNAT family N-acetyltransferase [Caldilineaceae bacterium]|nr:GNAT family N-acetyltransferase [Caldilineaceae bacterium]
MITEQPIQSLNQYRDQFPGAQPALAIASILDGNTAGQLWTISVADADEIVFLWDKGNNVFYLSGAPTAETEPLLKDLIQNEIRPRSLREESPFFKVRPFSATSAAALPQLFEGVTLHALRTRFYRFDQPSVNAHPQPTVEDLDFCSIDRAFLERDDLDNLDEIRGEVAWMWSSLDRFYAQGFGIAAVIADSAVCWCTAEYVSRSTCGIGIATVPDFQRRGIATAVAVRFVEESLRRGLIPHWECYDQNLPSVRVAEKAGFTFLEANDFWAGSFAQ